LYTTAVLLPDAGRAPVQSCARCYGPGLCARRPGRLPIVTRRHVRALRSERREAGSSSRRAARTSIHGSLTAHRTAGRTIQHHHHHHRAPVYYWPDAHCTRAVLLVLLVLVVARRNACLPSCPCTTLVGVFSKAMQSAQ
jgi:hypothetical protein